MAYITENGIIYASGIFLDGVDLDLVNSVLSFYKIPKHLTEVMVVIQSLEEAHSSLVLKGLDSKQRQQYIYGINYVKKRNAKRLDTVLFVHKNWWLLNESIVDLLKEPVGTKKFILGLILLISTKTFIRTGKKIHLNNNGTVGLLTLNLENVSIVDDKLKLKFIGKDSVQHDIRVLLIEEYLNLVEEQKDWVIKKGNKFFFSYSDNDSPECKKITEDELYTFLDNFGVKIKDIRTYGVNMLFILYCINNPNSSKKELKDIILEAIESTAKTIGHTKYVCIHSYLVIELLKFAKNNNLKNLTKNCKNSYEKVDIILNHIMNNNNKLNE